MFPVLRGLINSRFVCADQVNTPSLCIVTSVLLIASSLGLPNLVVSCSEESVYIYMHCVVASVNFDLPVHQDPVNVWSRKRELTSTLELSRRRYSHSKIYYTQRYIICLSNNIVPKTDYPWSCLQNSLTIYF